MPSPTDDRASDQPTGDGDGLLSVVVACWNGASTLAQQLMALELQDDDGPWELVVVDNGSTDSSLEVLGRFADRLPLRVLTATGGRGPGYARNAGVAEARGRLVAFCDADDVVERDWLRRMRAALVEHRFVAGRFRGDLLNEPWTVRARPLDQQGGLQVEPWLSPLPHAGAGNMGLHREVFLAVGGFDAGALHLEDTDLCWRLQLSGVPLVWAPDVVVQVRVRASLRTIARQAFAYGRGSRWLQRRHAAGGVVAGHDLAALDPAVRDAALAAAAPRPTAAASSVAAPRAARSWRGELGAALWSMGWRVGFRWPAASPGAGGPPATDATGREGRR